MADIFVSYARADKQRVAPFVTALEAQGWSVWWDPEITPGQEFDSLIRQELAAAHAVIVVWTPASVESRWVRGEARIAADRNVLVPVRFDRANLPIDALSIHTTDLDDWKNDKSSAAFQALIRALSSLIGAPKPGAKPASAPAISICVLPFVNMSGDQEQEYFSDGISEDIITDLSKVSSLAIVARNTAFTFKGKPVDVGATARQLKVSHILEGSVRKSGNRVRITAQLIDGSSGNHIWAERYDRDLADIFALQDEISEAIVAALRLKLLPEEKKAIERRGTTNPEAYKLHLMARRYRTGNASERNIRLVMRLYRKAVEIDPNYALAWAYLSIAQSVARYYYSLREDAAFSAERALALDPNLAEAHAAKAMLLSQAARYDEALAEAELALKLDPDCYEAHTEAARALNSLHRYAEAASHYERSAELVEADYGGLGMAVCCYEAIGDADGIRSAARRAVERIEKVLVAEPDNGSALSFGVTALAALGEIERAKEWTERALLFDPDNVNMQYNIACTFSKSRETDAALGMLEPLFAAMQVEALNWAKVDPDLNNLREDARYKAMVARAEARLARESAAAPQGASI
ncbi:MAG TPA: TIR domain-containing protein [Alphaproteobacteria bacterium]|nr:TIR domain-containing protein [Alphaproteobacteria bacterium]